MEPLPPRTQASLQYLRRLKPSDGYAIERYIATSGKTRVRLKRRNIPVRDEGFEEIVVDRSSGNVVGIRVLTSRGDVGRGITLVDENGKQCKGGDDDNADVTVRMANVSTTSAAGGSMRQSSSGSGGPPRSTRSSSSSSMPGSSRQTHGSRASTSSAAAAAASPLSDINNELLVQYGLMALGALLLLKIISALLSSLTILLLLPLLYLYATTTNRPPNAETFDAKRELKRVMRGAHLPEAAHRRRRPEGFFERGFNRLAASVTTELATSLGYEVGVTDYFGAARTAAVKVPAAGAEYYWLGVFGKWRFIGQREIAGNKND